MSLELSKLIELQELDIEIQRVADRLSRIPLERHQTENEFEQYAAEFLALKSKHQQTLEDRKHLEAELAITQQHHDKYKQDLMRVRNEKEYTTALREIDATKKHVGQLETEILKRMEELEKLEADLAVMAPDVERKRTDVDQSLAALDHERDQANDRSSALSLQREQLISSIPKNLLATYERMCRTRRGQALAEVSNDAICTACRMRVRPKVFSDVRKGNQLITCESCGRILYYRPEAPQSAELAMGRQEP